LLTTPLFPDHPTPLDYQKPQGRRPTDQQDAVQRLDPAQQAPIVLDKGYVTVASVVKVR
jgi:hypothetical protein